MQKQCTNNRSGIRGWWLALILLGGLVYRTLYKIFYRMLRPPSLASIGSAVSEQHMKNFKLYNPTER